MELQRRSVLINCVSSYAGETHIISFASADKSCGLTNECANELTCNGEKRRYIKSHAGFKYVSNSSVQDKLIILHVKKINVVRVRG
jgi:hypothetical protein